MRLQRYAAVSAKYLLVQAAQRGGVLQSSAFLLGGQVRVAGGSSESVLKARFFLVYCICYKPSGHELLFLVS